MFGISGENVMAAWFYVIGAVVSTKSLPLSTKIVSGFLSAIKRYHDEIFPRQPGDQQAAGL